MENKINPYDVDLSHLSMAELDTLAQENYSKMLNFSKEEAATDRGFYVASVLFVRAGNEYNKRRTAGEFMEQYNVLSDCFGTERADEL